MDLKGNTHVCQVEGCGKTFLKPSRLLHHARLHSGERPYICDVAGCGKQYTRSAHLRRHKAAAHVAREDRSRDVRCEFDGCSQMFMSRDNMKKHVHRFHTHRSYPCPEETCSESFRKKSQLRHHLSQHKNLQTFQCDVDGCEKLFTQNSHLQRHMKTHQGYVCQQNGCSLVFDKWSLLRKHRAAEHKSQFPCTTCGKVLPKKSMLRAHQKTHSNEREMFKCPHDDCGRAYLTLSNLRTHVRTYHDGVKHACQELGCGRRFSTKQKLQQHQALHDPSKPLPKKKYPKKGHRKKSESSKLIGVDPKQINGDITLASFMNTDHMEEDNSGFSSSADDDDIPLDALIQGSRVFWKEDESKQSNLNEGTELSNNVNDTHDNAICDMNGLEQQNWHDRDRSENTVIVPESAYEILDKEDDDLCSHLDKEISSDLENFNKQILDNKSDYSRSLCKEGLGGDAILDKDVKDTNGYQSNCENSDHNVESYNLIDCDLNRQRS